MAREVYTAVHATWQLVVAERTRRHRVTWSVAASVAAVVAIAGTLMLKISSTLPPSEPVAVASIVRIEGSLEVSRTPGVNKTIDTTGSVITVGDTIITTANARAALDFGTGLSVRLDHDTDVEMAAEDRLRLHAGALYIDANPTHSNPLIVETSTASIRHVGTQYLARIQDGGIDVSVREGRVLIADNGTIHTGLPGEKVSVSANGEIARTALPLQHLDWQWTSEIAPPFDIDGKMLASFLEWAARETGRRLVYASAAARAAAAQVELRGSIANLDIDTALEVVLSSTQLRRYPTSNEVIGITFNATTAAPD
ncbi:FecR family protein [Steroidobacter denitrificans]|uniref:FecR family protein n=1 Tax=Steroidobacter denitrificans TaxID=465721 RepID=UPI00143B9351|nr:FecR family protein [Steroidobacter denitrificans]